jgi:hypothetical protein
MSMSRYQNVKVLWSAKEVEHLPGMCRMAVEETKPHYTPQSHITISLSQRRRFQM